jgi:hypothetical protein
LEDLSVRGRFSEETENKTGASAGRIIREGIMSIQASLFDSPPIAHSRYADPPTSKAAAKNLDTNYLENIVLDALRSHPLGLTSHEVASITGLSLVTVSPRFRPLVNKNLIVDSGEKRSGVGFKTSIVWKAKL